MRERADKFWRIEKHIGTFEQSGSYTKECNLVSFGGKPAVLDLRAWTENEDGEKICCKGLTVTPEGAQKLIDMLQRYLRSLNEEEEETPAVDMRRGREADLIRLEMEQEIEKMYAV